VPQQKPLDVRTLPGELPPTLILAAERDAATPYDGAVELHKRLSGSVLVTENGAGTHGIGGGPNKCVNGYLDAYLLEGRVPENRTAACAPHAEPKPTAPGGRSKSAVSPKGSGDAEDFKTSRHSADSKTTRQAP
jgi:hypothetical protein